MPGGGHHQPYLIIAHICGLPSDRARVLPRHSAPPLSITWADCFSLPHRAAAGVKHGQRRETDIARPVLYGSVKPYSLLCVLAEV